MKITSKQKEVIDCIKYENPKILICSGAKRAGKTLILIYAFIGHVAKYENKGYRKEPNGFDFWQKLMRPLNLLADENDCPLNQIPQEVVNLHLKGRFGTMNQTINEFIDFIYEQDTSM